MTEGCKLVGGGSTVYSSCLDFFLRKWSRAIRGFSEQNSMNPQWILARVKSQLFCNTFCFDASLSDDNYSELIIAQPLDLFHFSKQGSGVNLCSIGQITFTKYCRQGKPVL